MAKKKGVVKKGVSSAPKPEKGLSNKNPAIIADPITIARKAKSSKASPKPKGRGHDKHFEYCDACEYLSRNSAELSQHRSIVITFFRRFHDELMGHPDVCGMHVGLKRVNNNIAFPVRYCIRLHVRKKWPIGHPMLDRPLNLDRFKDSGVEFDVFEQEYQSCVALSPPYPGNMIGGRPIHKDGFADSWGTMGIVVFTLDGQPRLLTNKHVAGEKDSVIRESNAPDALTWSGATEIVGKVEASVRDEKVDCAIVAPSPGLKMSRGVIKPDEIKHVLPGKYDVRRLTDIDVHAGTKVFKIGAATGFEPILIGEVKNTEATIELKDKHTMKGQIIIQAANQDIIKGGDSGSIAIVKGTDVSGPINFVVGLVHSQGASSQGSADPHTIIASHFDDVQSTLRISLFQT